MYRYAAQNVDPETTAKAVGRDIPVKPKFAVNVMRAIRGRAVPKAKRFLEDVIALERPVQFVFHNRNVKHRRGGGGPGRYPVNTAKAVLEVLKNAENNAEYKGLDPERMVVQHAAAHRAAPMPGHMPRAQGRATAWNKSTSHLEIVISERKKGSDEAEAASESPTTAKPTKRAKPKTAATATKPKKAAAAKPKAAAKKTPKTPKEA